MTRAIAVLCVVWLGSIGLATPQARQGRQIPPSHPALSLFAHSDDCVACHNQLEAPTGEDVSIGATWRATMMANSARDPYWQAGVRRETIDHPRHAAAIEDECAACHMPMSTRAQRSGGAAGQVFAHLPVKTDDRSLLHRLAADGVSCTVCHQITPDGLGTPESFNGNFGVAAPHNRARTAFGPYAVESGHRTVMQSVTGFQPAEAPHIKQSELCASCHTLITKAYGPDGDVIGSLPEQMNYQEWLHSDFAREQRTCQSCHMPTVEGPLRIASVLGETRDSLARHVFVGGNAFMVRMLARYRAPLGVEAQESELDATATATVRQLQTATAELTISTPCVTDGRLAFDVRVRNLTGHKLPTGYPARRVWLHVMVRDAAGHAVFESGALEPTGAIHGNDGDTSGPVYEPHHSEITRADDVQIYEAVLGDRTDAPTTGLLSAVRYLKDNRLLPRGFDKRTADPSIGVYGGASDDRDFAGEGDVTRYRVAISSPGPYQVSVAVRYQSIGYRWATTLERYKAPEPARFVEYYRRAAEDSAVTMATISASSR